MLPLLDPSRDDPSFREQQKKLFLVGRSLTELVQSLETLSPFSSETSPALFSFLTASAEWFAQSTIDLLSQRAAPDGTPRDFYGVEPQDSELVIESKAPLSKYFQYMTSIVQSMGYIEAIDIALLLGVRNKVLKRVTEFAALNTDRTKPGM